MVNIHLDAPLFDVDECDRFCLITIDKTVSNENIHRFWNIDNFNDPLDGNYITHPTRETQLVVYIRNMKYLLYLNVYLLYLNVINTKFVINYKRITL